jgi:hypothetical protein
MAAGAGRGAGLAALLAVAAGLAGGGVRVARDHNPTAETITKKTMETTRHSSIVTRRRVFSPQ